MKAHMTRKLMEQFYGVSKNFNSSKSEAMLVIEDKEEQ